MSTEKSDVLENQSHGSIVSDVDRSPMNEQQESKAFGVGRDFAVEARSEQQEYDLWTRSGCEIIRQGCVIFTCETEADAVHAVELHNAAVAAEREEVRVITNQCVQLRQELTATEKQIRDLQHEREVLRKSKAEQREEWHGTLKDLAAERQRADDIEHQAQTAYRIFQDEHQQLLSAQAAIEKHNRDFDVGAFDRKIDVDLSLLHQHDAEVRKPLVDALQMICGLTDIREIHLAADVALAQCK